MNCAAKDISGKKPADYAALEDTGVLHYSVSLHPFWDTHPEWHGMHQNWPINNTKWSTYFLLDTALWWRGVRYRWGANFEKKYGKLIPKFKHQGVNGGGNLSTFAKFDAKLRKAPHLSYGSSNQGGPYCKKTPVSPKIYPKNGRPFRSISAKTREKVWFLASLDHQKLEMYCF